MAAVLPVSKLKSASLSVSGKSMALPRLLQKPGSGYPRYLLNRSLAVAVLVGIAVAVVAVVVVLLAVEH